MNKKKKLSNILSSCLALLICAAVGFLCGYAIMDYADKLAAGGVFKNLLVLLSGLLLLALAYGIQFIIHEAGHLLFGLISGYEFVSFRIGSFLLIRGSDGKLSMKRYYLAGTAGQCLMAPPDFEEDGYLPVGLYNMGGVLLNAISAMFFFWAYYLSGGTVILPMFFLCHESELAVSMPSSFWDRSMSTIAWPFLALWASVISRAIPSPHAMGSATSFSSSSLKPSTLTVVHEDFPSGFLKYLTIFSLILPSLIVSSLNFMNASPCILNDSTRQGIVQ